jgi:hypothetical protein
MLLRNELRKKAGRLAVFLEGEDSVAADLMVDGSFTTIDEGGSLREGVVGIDGLIRRPDGIIVAEFGTQRSSRGGLLGTGFFSGGSGRVMHDILSEIASEVAGFMTRNMSQDLVLSEQPAFQQPVVSQPAP